MPACPPACRSRFCGKGQGEVQWRVPCSSSCSSDGSWGDGPAGKGNGQYPSQAVCCMSDGSIFLGRWPDRGSAMASTLENERWLIGAMAPLFLGHSPPGKCNGEYPVRAMAQES